MSRKILIVFATHEEASSTIKELGAKLISDRFYQIEKGFLLISGMGTIAAAHEAGRYMESVDEVWNFGIAGSLIPSLGIESFVSISNVGKHLSFPQQLDDYSMRFAEKIYPSFDLQHDGFTLISSDYPIHHPSSKKALAKQWDLVDMEGYGIVFACQQRQKKCKLWKIISDLASSEGPSKIKDNLPFLSKKLWYNIEALI